MTLWKHRLRVGRRRGCKHVDNLIFYEENKKWMDKPIHPTSSIEFYSKSKAASVAQSVITFLSPSLNFALECIIK